MITLAVLFLIAFAASCALVPLTRRLFIACGKLDHPQGRKMHRQPIPRSGGLAVVLAYLLAVGFITILPAGGNYVFFRHEDFLVRLFPAVAIVFVTGLFDDLMDLRPRYKLVGQFLAAAFACQAGIGLFDAPPEWEWLEFSLTCFWLVLCSNAFNLIDGTDGLAGCLAVLSCLGLIAVSLSWDFYPLALIFTPLLAAVLPFLRANWPPATIFLGDTGSITLGFLIGCGGAALTRRFPGSAGASAALLIFTLPLLELVLSSARRWLRGQSIFTADAAHIHHQLKRQGHDDSAVLLRLSALSCAGTLLAVGQFWVNPAWRLIMLVHFLLYLGFKVASLRYPEFNVLWEAFWGGRIRAWFRHQVLLKDLDRDLSQASSSRLIGISLRESAQGLGLLELNLKIADYRFQEALPASCEEATYAVRIDLPHGNWVNFRVPVRLKRTENPAADFAAVITRALNSPRLAQLAAEPAALDPRPLATPV